MTETQREAARAAYRRWRERHKNDPEIQQRLKEDQKRYRQRNINNAEFLRKRRESCTANRLQGRDDEAYRLRRLESNRKWLDQSPEKKEIFREATRKWREKNKHKSVAHWAVKDAIASGELIRTNTCERCGVIPPPGRDGRTSIHAHHADYSKPLEVSWLCAFCHGNERRRR